MKYGSIHVTFISRHSSFLIFIWLSFFPSHLKKMSFMLCGLLVILKSFTSHLLGKIYLLNGMRKAFSFSTLKDPPPLSSHLHIFSMRNKSSFSLILYIKMYYVKYIISLKMSFPLAALKIFYH